MVKKKSKAEKDKERKERLKKFLFYLNVTRDNDEANKKPPEVEEKPEKSKERKELEEQADAGLIKVANIRERLGKARLNAERNWEDAASGWLARMNTEEAGVSLSR